MKCIRIVAACWFMSCTVQARPEGAHERACETMDPGHNTVPQTGPSPYLLTMDTHRINSDGCVYFTIKAKSPHTFTGFMVQARGERENRPVGVFTESEDIKLMDCFGEPENTATHPDDSPKTEVTMRWVPSNGYAGTVIFHDVNQTKYLQCYCGKDDERVLGATKSKTSLSDKGKTLITSGGVCCDISSGE